MTDHDPTQQPLEPTPQPSPTARRASNMAREMRVGLSIIFALLITLGAVLYYRIDADARKATAMKAHLAQSDEAGELTPDEQPLHPGQHASWDAHEESGTADAISTTVVAPAADQVDSDWSQEPQYGAPLPPDNPFAQPGSPAAEPWSHDQADPELAGAPATEPTSAEHDFGHDADFPQFSPEAQDLNFEDETELTDNGQLQWQDETETGEPGLFAPIDEPAPVAAQPAPRTVVSEPVDDRWARRPGAAVAPASAGDAPWADRRPGADSYQATSSPYGDQPTTPAHAGDADAGVFDRHDNSYTVGPNENFWAISKRLYGSGAYFKALYEHNRRNYPYPNKLRVGDVISAPPLHVLEQTYPQLCPKRSAASNSASKYHPVAHRPVPAGSRMYVVAEGDTLTDIARYELGRAARWTEIYDLNREVLGDNYDLLRPGTELVLPAESRPDRLTENPSPLYQR